MERFKCDDCKNNVDEMEYGYQINRCSKGHWDCLAEDKSNGEDIYYTLWDGCLDFQEKEV